MDYVSEVWPMRSVLDVHNLIVMVPGLCWGTSSLTMSQSVGFLWNCSYSPGLFSRREGTTSSDLEKGPVWPSISERHLMERVWNDRNVLTLGADGLCCVLGAHALLNATLMMRR